MKYTFSVVLPLYKQDDQIEAITSLYKKNLLKIGSTLEILLVVNGPTSLNENDIKRISSKDGSLKIFILKESGWGRAVRFGISEASGDFICYTNSARTDIGDLVNMLVLAKKNSPYLIKANRIIRDFSSLRKLGSILYNFEFRLLFRVPVWDVNGTPKIFPKNAIKAIDMSSNDDLIDAEILYKVYKNKHHVLEFPIYSNKRIGGESTTKIFSALNMYIGLFNLYRSLVKIKS